MAKRMLIDAQHPEETRVVIADENQIYDFDFVSTSKKQLKGNIYLAKITRVEPSLQAAFVEYGGGKQGFLPFAEIHADYYQIPVSDRKRLMEEQQREEAAEEAAERSGAPREREPEPEHQPEAAIGENGEHIPAEGEAPHPEELPAKEDDGDRPAYLMQGAIDISTSQEVEAPDHAEEHALVAQPDHGEPVELHAAEGEILADLSLEASAKEEGVETLPSEEEEYRPKKNIFTKRYKIQEVIRRGQIVLVQVIKEERGNKGCSLTTYLSLAGRYCVLMPNSPKDGGISRKIANAEDRKRLKSISTELRLATGMSVIVRTAGMDRTRAEIKRDYDYLVKLWNQIREDTLKSNAPALIYEESDIIKRAIRDQYSNDIDELIIEGDDGYNAAREFMKLLLPSHTPKIKHYKEATPLFYAYNIEEQLLSMHDPVVKLRSGGYIVINPTEALISVDVNSGRATGERNIEETALKTNLEAAAEVARQLRLRDLAGLIVIDFIDMMESRNRRAVEKILKDSLKADRAKIQLGRISPFGLLEMSRQRLRPSISESNMVQCQHCIGRGVVRSNESMSIQMVRALEKEASSGSWIGLRLVVPQEVALHLLNTKRDALRTIEQRHNITVQVVIGADIAAGEFNLEKIRRSQGGESGERDRDRERRPRRPERERGERPERKERFERPRPEEGPHDEASNDNIGPVSEGSIEMMETPRDEFGGGDRGGKNRSRRRRGGRNRNDRDRDPNRERPAPVLVEGEPAETQEIAATGDIETPVNADGTSRPPRTRGGRGRRRWRDRDDRGPKDANAPAGEAPSYGEAPVHAHAMANADGNTLPAFATQEPVAAPPPPKPYDPYDARMQPAQPASSEGPVKKGWWQKMIDLDD